MLTLQNNLGGSSRNKKILWTSRFGSANWEQTIGQETFLKCPEQRFVRFHYEKSVLVELVEFRFPRIEKKQWYIRI